MVSFTLVRQMSPGTSARMDTAMHETLGRGLGFGVG